MLDTRTPLEDVLVDGLTDRGNEATFFFYASLTGRTDLVTLRAVAIGLITDSLVRNLVVPGDLCNGEFVPWCAPTDEAIVRIARTWTQEWPHQAPTTGSIVWFKNTERGDGIAEMVLSREGSF